MKHDIDNRASALQTTRVAYIVSKRHDLWSTNGLKLDRSFYRPSVNSGFVARRCTQRSAKRSQPNFAKCNEVNGVYTIEVNKEAPHGECK